MPEREELDRAELLITSMPVERVVEELAVPVDPRHARALEELLAHHLVPEVVDLLGLGEEAVAAEIEAVAVADLGLGEAADLVLGLEHDHGTPLLGEQVAGGQAGGAAAEDGDRLAGRRRRVRSGAEDRTQQSTWRTTLPAPARGTDRFLKAANRP